MSLSYGNRPLMIALHFGAKGCHYRVEGNGHTSRLLPESAIGAHWPGYDSRSIGVGLIGNAVTPAQVASLRKLQRIIARGRGSLPLFGPDSIPWDEVRIPRVAAPTMFRGDPSSRRPDFRIMAWQRIMRDRGWDVPVTGEFCETTSRACLAFQTEKRGEGYRSSNGRPLEISGAIDRWTWEAAFIAPVTRR